MNINPNFGIVVLLWSWWINLDRGNGQKLQSCWCAAELESNVEKDGTIISGQTL